MILAIAATACGSGGSGSGGVTISKPWARTTASGAANGAVYFTMRTNAGDSLTAAAVDAKVAAKAELHETMQSGESMNTASTMTGSSMMSMQPVTAIDLPKGTDVVLQPGGYHVMLFDLAEPLTAGRTIKVTLTFAKAGTKIVDVPVRDIAP